MSQINSPVIEERINFYSQFDAKELEFQLLEEKSYQNRNIIRQVIRKKRKEKDDNVKKNEPDSSCKDGSNQEIEKLKIQLNETSDFFEQCKIRSTILLLQKNEKKSDLEKQPSLKNIDCGKENCVIKESMKKKTTTGDGKKLVFDEISPNNNILSTVLCFNDSFEFSWIMPFKILSSIEYTWTRADTKIPVSQTSHLVVGFDGKCASLKIENLKTTDNGLYKLAIHSQRLKRTFLKFNILVNTDNQQLTSTIIDEFVLQKEKPKTDSCSTPAPIYEPKPRLLHKNRFNRHKTMVGQEMLESIKTAQMKDANQNSINIDESSNISPIKQTPLRRFNRSATSAKDIILMFCKLNTEEYEPYGVCVDNLSSSWSDGLAFCALIHHFHPEAFDFSKLNKVNRKFNFELAFTSADKYADIYPLLDIDDMMIMEKPDWKCIFTYVQCFYKAFRTHPSNRLKTVPIS